MSNEHAKLPYLVQDTLKQLSVKHSIVLYRGLVLDVSSLSHPGGNQLLKPFLMADIT
jgi:cytochrome b involved in lipid metabolism